MISEAFNIFIIVAGIFFYVKFLKLKREAMKIEGKTLGQDFGLLLAW